MAETKYHPQQQKHRFNQDDDSACIAEWRRMLALFHSSSKDDKKKLISLKDEAKINKKLTYRQVDGICARVDNVFNGTYGKTKTELQMNAGRVK